MKDSIKYYRDASYVKVKKEFSIHLLLIGLVVFSASLLVGSLALLKWIEHGF
jgi:hypothetical protein